MSKAKLSGLDWGIVVLALATALMHFSLSVLMGKFSPLFTINGLGYLALLAALFLPLPMAQDHRNWVRFVMIGFTLVTILAWIVMADKTWWYGILNKLIEVGLVVLLFRKRP